MAKVNLKENKNFFFNLVTFKLKTVDYKKRMA